MTTALWCVFVAGLLPYAASVLSKAGAKGFDNNDPRGWLARQEGFRARANAAQQNSWEAFPLFAAAVIIAHVVNGPQARADQLAIAFIALRLLYIGAYIAGWGAVRSLVWAAGMAATVWIFLLAG